jgi:hypothetical protein
MKKQYCGEVDIYAIRWINKEGSTLTKQELSVKVYPKNKVGYRK